MVDPQLANLQGLWPDLCNRYPVLRPAIRWSILWHGSMTRGIADELADIDLWCLGSMADVEALDAVCPTRFFAFEHQGRSGHLNVEALEDVEARITACDLPLIAELRIAHVLADPDRAAARLLARAALPMPPEVRAAWFRFHYVEFRGEHRSTDNPAGRGHAVALLLATGNSLREALRAAMVLDGRLIPTTSGCTPMRSSRRPGRRLFPVSPCSSTSWPATPFASRCQTRHIRSCMRSGRCGAS